MNAISMNSLWGYLQGLSLTANNRKWLAERLVESLSEVDSVKETETKVKTLVFPKIPKDYKPSPEVLAMSCGSLPKDFDADIELDNMWEEWAR